MMTSENEDCDEEGWDLTDLDIAQELEDEMRKVAVFDCGCEGNEARRLGWPFVGGILTKCCKDHQKHLGTIHSGRGIILL